ncbi:MAG: HipA domain-containing protein [Elusimicrobia bacterium]|nr:HipA domain-containing protein [Elusimicrobiota bacterium]
MASCLCCTKPIADEEGRYHRECVKELFGSTRVPAIAFGLAELPAQVLKTGARMSISGVQIKASVRLNADKSRLEVVAAGGTHILKPEPHQFPALPQNENLCMSMAADLDLPVPPHGLLPMADGSSCYVVARFDRAGDEKLQNETMFQILQSTEKYGGSLERIGKAIRTHATNVGLDSIDFFERVLFCFLTGNGDMHLKNWALVMRGKIIALAPCYDLVCSKIYLTRETESALTIAGKNDKLKRSDFETLAKNLGIDAKALENIFEKFHGAQARLREAVGRSELPIHLKRDFDDVIKARYNRLYAGSQDHRE